MNGLYLKNRLRKAKRFAAREKSRFAGDKGVDKKLRERHICLIRVAARFFSGVPHPHLLGVCCPDFPNAISKAKLDVPEISF